MPIRKGGNDVIKAGVPDPAYLGRHERNKDVFAVVVDGDMRQIAELELLADRRKMRRPEQAAREVHERPCAPKCGTVAADDDLLERALVPERRATHDTLVVDGHDEVRRREAGQA